MTFAAAVFADMVMPLVFQTDKTTGLGGTLNYKGQLNQWLCDLMTWSKVGCRNSERKGEVKFDNSFLKVGSTVYLRIIS